MNGELDIVRTVIAWALIGSGAIFIVISAIGINRMPDVFTRLHAVSVGDTFGAGLMLAGMMVVGGFTLVTVKLIFLLLFLWFMAPVATHAIARAALQAGEKPVLARDDVAADGKEGASSKP